MKKLIICLALVGIAFSCKSTSDVTDSSEACCGTCEVTDCSGACESCPEASSCGEKSSCSEKSSCASSCSDAKTESCCPVTGEKK